MGRGKGLGWTTLGQMELRRPPQAKKKTGHGGDAGGGWARRERRDGSGMVEEDAKGRIWTAPGQVELCRTPQSKKMTGLVQWKGRRLTPRALPGWEKEVERGRSTPRAHSCSSLCRGTPESNTPSLAARCLAPMMRNATMRNRRDGISGSAADEWEFQRRHWLGSRVAQGEGGVGAVLHGGEGVCLVSFDFSDLCCLPTGVVAPLEALFLPIQSLLKKECGYWR